VISKLLERSRGSHPMVAPKKWFVNVFDEALFLSHESLLLLSALGAIPYRAVLRCTACSVVDRQVSRKEDNNNATLSNLQAMQKDGAVLFWSSLCRSKAFVLVDQSSMPRQSVGTTCHAHAVGEPYRSAP
jgi:hypothetical protein